MNNTPSNYSYSAADSSGQSGGQMETMRLPLFPLNTVLFPGMMLPLNVFEPRYLDLVNDCVEKKSPFGIVLIRSGKGIGVEGVPHLIGTAARIKKVQKKEDGRMSVVVVGTRRFQVEAFDHSRAYLSAEASLLPFTDADTRVADDLMQQIRPDIMEYVELIAKASKVKVRMERFPADPKSTAFLIAGALQVENAEKQALLAMASVPEILVRERYLLSRETLIMRYMVETQKSIMGMGAGPTGHLFPN